MLVASVMGRHEVENEGVLVLPFNLLKDDKDVDRSISLAWSFKARFATDDSISVHKHFKKVQLVNILGAARPVRFNCFSQVV